MNSYQQMVAKHRKEISEFPLVYGFGKEQIDEGMRKLGLKPSERNKVTSYFGVGDFLRITDVPALKSMLRRHEAERKAAIAADKTGEGFIFDMVDTIMADHEFGYTQDFTDTLYDLGMTVEQVNAFYTHCRKLQKNRLLFM